ncbi:MAG: redoxin family protein [Isosphaerales bacterium]
MRIPRLIHCLLLPVCSLAGCSQTAGFRSNPPSNVKTVASLGDKPLPIVSGEPGASLRAETEDLDLPPSRGARISGRVYDDRGKPVSNAKVRLAVGSAPGGRVVYAMTDRSGAFTLHGLQSGSSYTVIAEYQGDDGMMTGRAQAKAPQGDVRIGLLSRDGESEQGHASIRPARPRVEPISNVDPADDDGTAENGRGGRINSEDMDPPAAEAATLLPRKNLQASRQAFDSSREPVRAGWNVRQTGSKKDANASGESRVRDEEADSTSRSGGSDRAAEDLDDDGPNPLPPALETGAVSSTRPAVVPEADPTRLARSEARASSRPRRARADGNLDQDGLRASVQADQTADQAPRPIPEDLLPGERVITPGSYAPIAVTDPREANTPSAPARQRARHAALSGGPEDSTAPAADPSRAMDSSDARDPTASRRPTWRELSLKQGDVPVDESIHRAAGAAQAGEQGVITLTSASRPARPGLSRLLAGPRPPVDESVKQSVCRIDPNERRLVDFKLPDVGGKLVSLHDIDADVILLDFWGSWCAPCRKSIPHLIELQEELAGKRFQVVGIACEKGAAPQDRRASAAKAIQDLGIRYPVLLSSMDGSCPVQQALQVQFYPTMILLDREGRLLAREQGATDATLPRMDRAIALALRSYRGGDE